MSPLGPWPSSRRIAVAVSGGADSLCLAYLCAQWGHPYAYIVDHGLRAASAAEAAHTARRLDGLKIPNRVLTLHGLRPGPAMAERARAARYEALVQAATQAGFSDLLLGHHRLDQAETVLIRRQAGSGPAGLAAMASIYELNGLRLVRPMLGVPPSLLRETLRQAGLAWVEDPSNHDPSATRARVRLKLADPDGTADGTLALSAQAARHGAVRAAEDVEIARILAGRVQIRPEGFAVLAPDALPAPALAALIRTIGGAPYEAAGRSVARLAAKPSPGVLGGVRLMPAGRFGPGFLVVREAAAMAPPEAATHGAVWDRRFALHAPHGLPAGMAFGPVGADAARLRRLSPLPSAVLQTLPALRLQGALAAVPHIGYRLAGLHLDMAVRFSPAHPLAGAPFGVAPTGCGGGCEERHEAPC